jgi:hypothetical protein
MATHAICVLNKVQAANVDSLNRTVVSGSPIDNGNIFCLNTRSATAGEGEVFVATWPVTGSLVDLWMAASPEVVTFVDDLGKKYKANLSNDPRLFYSSAGEMIDAIKLQPGDIITLTAEAFEGAKGTSDTYANIVTQKWKFNWAAFQAASALSLKLLETTYISIGSGGIDSQRVTAYRFEVLAN